MLPLRLLLTLGLLFFLALKLTTGGAHLPDGTVVADDDDEVAAVASSRSTGDEIEFGEQIGRRAPLAPEAAPSEKAVESGEREKDVKPDHAGERAGRVVAVNPDAGDTKSPWCLP